MTEDAMAHSRETRHALEKHILLSEAQMRRMEESAAARHTALVEASDARHLTLNGNLQRLESMFKWAGSLIITAMISVLGWSVLQQINANEAQRLDMQRQLELLQAQEFERRESHARATHSAAAPSAVAQK